MSGQARRAGRRLAHPAAIKLVVVASTHAEEHSVRQLRCSAAGRSGVGVGRISGQCAVPAASDAPRRRGDRSAQATRNGPAHALAARHPRGAIGARRRAGPARTGLVAEALQQRQVEALAQLEQGIHQLLRSIQQQLWRRRRAKGGGVSGSPAVNECERISAGTRARPAPHLSPSRARGASATAA